MPSSLRDRPQPDRSVRAARGDRNLVAPHQGGWDSRVRPVGRRSAVRGRADAGCGRGGCGRCGQPATIRIPHDTGLNPAETVITQARRGRSTRQRPQAFNPCSWWPGTWTTGDLAGFFLIASSARARSRMLCRTRNAEMAVEGPNRSDRSLIHPWMRDGRIWPSAGRCPRMQEPAATVKNLLTVAAGSLDD